MDESRARQVLWYPQIERLGNCRATQGTQSLDQQWLDATLCNRWASVGYRDVKSDGIEIVMVGQCREANLDIRVGAKKIGQSRPEPFRGEARAGRYDEVP